ncbi:hypothetical protein [Aeromonas hydrophila]|uniref:hypothetical protein n=1 Tax=Aeromonas hydrophila TaxID=644 RepID=UPI002B498292|nr:hypothetical protein [Aeromonas hydrophila]
MKSPLICTHRHSDTPLQGNDQCFPTIEHACFDKNEYSGDGYLAKEGGNVITVRRHQHRPQEILFNGTRPKLKKDQSDISTDYTPSPIVIGYFYHRARLYADKHPAPHPIKHWLYFYRPDIEKGDNMSPDLAREM